jgi:glycosyltransferase involved in cell wall biosynthesis
MKICLITEYFYPEDSGGSPTLLSQLMRYLKDHFDDLEVDVVTSNNLYRRTGGKLPASEDWNGVQIYRVNSPRSNQSSTAMRLLAGCVFSAKALTKLFATRKYDLVLVGTNPPTAPLVGRWLWQRYGTPYCYLVHDLYPDIAIGLGALRRESNIAHIAKECQRTWLRDASAVVVLGRCMREYISTAYQVPKERISVMTNWCDPRDIIPMPKETAFRAKHGLTGFLVVYAGSIGRSQGLDTVLDAAKLLQTSHPTIHFALIGSGDAWKGLLARIADERLRNIQLLPAVPNGEYSEVLASADASLVSLDTSMDGLAVPSKSYNILSSGRPLIALMSAASEVSRMVVEHHCGVQVDQGNAEQLAAVIAGLFTNPAQGIQMGRNGRAALEQHYTIERIAEQYGQLLQEVALRQQTRLLA